MSYHRIARRAMKEIADKAQPVIIDELTNQTNTGFLTSRHWGDLIHNGNP